MLFYFVMDSIVLFIARPLTPALSPDGGEGDGIVGLEKVHGFYLCELVMKHSHALAKYAAS